MRVFITGGAGFLGRAYLRWMQKEHPTWGSTIFSRDEGKHSRCRRDFPQHQYLIGDVRDYNSVEMAMAGHDIVIHAAAFKYVPQAETNVSECHEINVTGSLNVARAAIRCGILRCVGISTDKACEPINVYGITKLLMERLFQEANERRATQFNLVRYGNVVSSTGSVIPVFRRQLEQDGYISLTDPDMTRFWLPVEQGVWLINQALNEPTGGTILIPRLPSISMSEIAQLVLTDKRTIKVVGQRFGEKRHESLISEVEAQYAVDAGQDVMRLYPTFRPFTGMPVGVAYSSDKPDWVLTPKQLQKLIDEAPE